jgi:hypothetical protein
MRQRRAILEEFFRQMAGGTGDLAIGAESCIEEESLTEGRGALIIRVFVRWISRNRRKTANP